MCKLHVHVFLLPFENCSSYILTDLLQVPLYYIYDRKSMYILITELGGCPRSYNFHAKNNNVTDKGFYIYSAHLWPLA